jgi:opacity protein-like surface antigen
MCQRLFLGAVLVAALAGHAESARAQAFGIGPRLSFVKNEPAGQPATRFFGGTIRLRSSRHVATELALDYRKYDEVDHQQRVREMPFQASLLLFPVRSVFSPYLLGGFGIYSHATDDLTDTGAVIATTTERKTGWHLGLGAELFVNRHAALFVDYRYRFVKFGAEPDSSPADAVIPGLDISHNGSMWTSGVAFYF